MRDPAPPPLPGGNERNILTDIAAISAGTRQQRDAGPGYPGKLPDDEQSGTGTADRGERRKYPVSTYQNHPLDFHLAKVNHYQRERTESHTPHRKRFKDTCRPYVAKR